MPTTSPGVMFYGRLQPTQWPYLYRLFQAAARHYDRVCVPCCGTFAVAELALKAGFKPEQIETSDICLYSSVIGYAIMQRDAAELGVVTNDLKLPSSVDLNTYGGILYAMKYAINENLRMKGKLNAYTKMFHDDLRRRAREHVDELNAQLDAYRAGFAGINYSAMDMFEHMEMHERDPKSMIALWPPFVDGDYEKMFDTGPFLSWDEPDALYFSPRADYAALRERMVNAKALACWYTRNPSEEDTAIGIFGVDDGKGQMRMLCTNRPQECIELTGGISVAEKRRPDSVSANLPIMPADHEITVNSSIQVIPISGVQATYYRDLFVHRMGATIAERSYLLLVDGMVMAVMGMNLMRFNIGDQDYVEETYGICRTSRYWRLGRLLNQVLVSREFLTICSDAKVNRKPTGVRGTVWSRHPESKADRGVFKIVDRVFDTKVGMYKIRIHGKARELTLKQTLADWLKREEAYWKEFGHRRRRLSDPEILTEATIEEQTKELAHV